VGWATKIYSTLTPGDASHADHLDKPPNKVQLANACEELKEASASIRAGVSPVKSGGPPGGGGGAGAGGGRPGSRGGARGGGGGAGDLSYTFYIFEATFKRCERGCGC